LFDFEPAGLFFTFGEVCWLPYAPRPLLAGGTLHSRRPIMRQMDYGAVRMNMTPIWVSSRQIVWHVLAGDLLGRRRKPRECRLWFEPGGKRRSL